MTWIAGVDGYKSRWFVVLQNLASLEVRYRIVEPFSELLHLAETPKIVAVDIPIGLPEVARPGGRACERHARAVLGGRKSSVFNAVGRETLKAGGQPEASASSKAAGGIGIGVQAWGLAAKLREADEAMTPAAQAIVREVHPEVCFWAMNGQTSMAFAKKEARGEAERRAALVSAGQPFAVTMPADIRVGRDDFLDACAAAWTAARILAGEAQRFPPAADLDARGLDQAIWF